MSTCEAPFQNPYLAYLARGWSAIPLLPQEKLPDTDLLPKVWDEEIKARRHSWKPYQRACAGVVQARIWFARRPQGNVGIVTGQVSGLIVLDLDGDLAVAHARERGLPHTPTVRTAKGLHLYLKYPDAPAEKLTNRANLLAGNPPGYDIRADGGYVVSPPSIHPDGHRYAWEVSPDEAKLAPLPAWLLALLGPAPIRGASSTADAAARAVTYQARGTEREQTYGARALQQELDQLAGTQEGERNNRLNRAAFKLGQLVGGKLLGEAEVAKALLATAMGTGLPQGEALKTIESGLRAGKKKPRQLPDFSQTENEEG